MSEQLPYNEEEGWDLDEVWTCPNCDGWGFEIAMVTQWEESFDSPIPCIHCAGLGYVNGG